jgi:hypothetical protein
MHRKTDIQDLDIPRDDIDCWNRYPKHRWIHDLSRLLDAQGIKWSPFSVEFLPNKQINIDLKTDRNIVSSPGIIYTEPHTGQNIITEMYITKGEIKLMRHIDPSTGKELPDMYGEVELRLNAFITLHFQKFTGVISAESWGHEIFKIRLRPHVSPILESNAEVIKLLKRIYKKNDLNVNGLTDRALQETLAS